MKKIGVTSFSDNYFFFLYHVSPGIEFEQRKGKCRPGNLRLANIESVSVFRLSNLIWLNLCSDFTLQDATWKLANIIHVLQDEEA